MKSETEFFHENGRKFIILIIIVSLFLFLVYSINSFTPAMLGSLLFYVLFRKFMRHLIEIRKWKRWGAALLIIFISFLLIVVPVSSLSYLLFDKVQTILSNPQDVILGYHTLINKINDSFGREIVSNKIIDDFTKTIAVQIPSILNSTLQIFSSLLIMYFILFYLLIYTGDLEKSIFSYLPFKKDGITILTKELNDMTYANAIAVPLIALCQGLIASIGFLIFGLQDPFFWGIICGCTSIIPVVGAALIWFPAGIFLLSTSAFWQGAGILVYGVLVISTVDNILRFFFARWFADVHPLITIFGIIIGIKWFGLPGLVFGPLFISYFFLMLKIYKKEFPAT